MEQNFGKYKVLREVGKGGMGIVYKGLDPSTQQPVAIKVLPPTMVDKSTVERFTREAQAMTRLKHENIVAAFETGMQDGKHFIVMEFVEGANLKEAITRKGSFNIDEFIAVTVQVAKALAYAHKEGGIAHRDIKPANILIQNDGKVKVMDFGLVQIPGVTRVTMEGAAVGTVEYMSPEQISDEPLDTRTDLYSLGVTMYEMLTGRLPFKGESLQSTMMKQKMDAPPPMRPINPRIPPEIEQIVLKAMAKKVDQRYQKAEEIIADLEKFKPLPKKIEPAPIVRPDIKAKREAPPVQAPVKASAKASVSLGQEKKFPVVFVWVGIAVVVMIAAFFAKDKIAGYFSSFTSGEEEQADLTNQTQDYLQVLEMAEERFTRGQKYVRESKHEKAVAEFKEAIKLRKDHSQYYQDLALSYEALGDNTNALATWRKLVQVDDGGSLTASATEHINSLIGN